MNTDPRCPNCRSFDVWPYDSERTGEYAFTMCDDCGEEFFDKGQST